ncbi:formin-like protein 8 isoform X2 [Bombyx mandarina]|uniref:Formin-like protein 8 isoform X2 n=1 Tax=Bombyx mandarina TaxID=7092 RepID=A0A6J2JPN7_BOMMA|nr:formin-like protein 8 isoform X2 [Bombyx mandarina]
MRGCAGAGVQPPVYNLGRAPSVPVALRLQTPETYLYPVFEALESGDTPNYEDIHRYLRDGIDLDYVEAYRRHVPVDRPPTPPPPAPPSPPPPPPPLLWPPCVPPFLFLHNIQPPPGFEPL